MRNRQVGPDAALDTLADLVSKMSYKPGWRFELQELDRGQGSVGCTLLIWADVVDSINGGMTQVCHLMPVFPAAYDRVSWTYWLMEQILLVEKHEAMEFFRINGAAPFFSEHAPGRDPYRMAIVKSQEDVDRPAQPWNGGPSLDAHFL